MQRFHWELARLARGLGLPGGVAVLLLVLCALGWWQGVATLEDRTVSLAKRSAELRARLAKPQADTPSIELAPRQQLEAFRERFGDAKSLPNALATLHAAAERQGLRLDQAEFRLSRSPQEPLARYQIVLPVKAEYGALRRFTRDAMRSLPGLALEELSLRRGDGRSTVVDAQLRFVLFVLA